MENNGDFQRFMYNPCTQFIISNHTLYHSNIHFLRMNVIVGCRGRFFTRNEMQVHKYRLMGREFFFILKVQPKDQLLSLALTVCNSSEKNAFTSTVYVEPCDGN